MANQQLQKMDLSPLLVLITGSSRGLGAVIARRFHACGASVVINYLSSSAQATALADALNSASSSDTNTGKRARALALQADVTSPTQVHALFAAAAAHFQRPITTVVNNALAAFTFNGDAARAKLDVITWAAFDAQLQGSVRGALNTLQAALAQSQSQPQSQSQSLTAVVNIGSNLVASPVVPYHDYTAGKGALLAFTRTAAAELGARGVTCNMVSGGLLRGTDASAATPEEVFEGVAGATPLGRVTACEEVADAVLFFASPWARGVTGQNLNVDGGLVMG